MVDRFRIVVVDNYPIFREALVRTFRRDRHLVVVAECATAEDAERFVSEKSPDVLLLEAAVPGSLRFAQSVLRAHENVKVVFLASVEDQEHVTRALNAGVHGYIMKDISGSELVKVIKAVRSGGRYITSDLAWHVVTKPLSTEQKGSIPDLTPQEQQILDCISRGLTDRETAHTMGRGIGTIKWHKTIVFRKLGVRNRLEALAVVNKIGQ